MCNQEVCLSFGVHDLDALIALFTAADEIEMLLEWFLQLRLELHPSKEEFAAQLFTAMYHAQLKTAQGFRDFQQLLFKVTFMLVSLITTTILLLILCTVLLFFVLLTSNSR